MIWVVVTTASVITLWVVAGLSALGAARTARTPQGAIGWVVFLLTSPAFALPAYLLFGHHRFKGYRTSRQQAHALLGRVRDQTARLSDPPKGPLINTAPFEAVSGMRASRGNDYKLLIDGEQAFSAMFQAINRANDYLLVQFYIVRDDTLGSRLKTHLISAAQRGVTVWFMYDRVGSHRLSKSYLTELSQAGINLVDPSSYRGPKHRFQINFRNHRKTIIADGKVGFTGGLNVGDEYLGKDPSFGNWRDTHIQLTGPTVQQLQLSFAEDWHWLTEEPILDLLNWDIEPSAADKTALIVPTGPGDTTENASMMFFSAICAARERIWIASPYFVPDLDAVAALKHAALMGVDVRILLPEPIDHYLPWLAAFAYFDDLRRAGVKIYRYRLGFMHQKVFLVDTSLTGVGTANMDNRSFRLNFETMALLFDQNAAEDVSRMLERDFGNAELLTTRLENQSLFIKLLAPVARLLSPVL